MRRMITKKTEAFRAGYAPTAAQKIFNVIGRRLGTSIKMSPVPMDYSNSTGKYTGYIGNIGNGEMVRVNFHLGKSDRVISVDYWKKPATKPDYTIDLSEFNVVQIIDTVVDVITGDYFDDLDLIEESKIIREQAPFTRLMKMQPKTNKEMLAYWLSWSDNEDWYEGLQQRGKTDFDALFEAYSKDAIKHRIKPPKTVSSFRVLVSTTLKWMRQEEAAESVPVASVKKGVPEDYVETTPEEADEFQELMSNSHIQKFELMRHICEEMAKGNKEYLGAYVFGTGGIGKSYLARQILEPLPNTYYTKGTISGYTGLLQMLFDHKDGEILVLDDIVSPKHMGNPIIENILKAVLDPDPPRRVKVEKKLAMGAGAGDDDEEVAEDSIYDFEFNSSIMFITNYDKIPQALEDRCWTIKMIFNNQQIADIIENALPNIIGTVPKEDKEFVLDFLRKHLAGKKLSFRLLKRCVSVYMAFKDDSPSVWKSQLLMQMTD